MREQETPVEKTTASPSSPCLPEYELKEPPEARAPSTSRNERCTGSPCRDICRCSWEKKKRSDFETMKRYDNAKLPNISNREAAEVETSKTSCLQEEVALIHVLKEIATRKNLQEGTKMHDYITQRGFLQKSIHVGSTLINLYGKCGALSKARQVFDELPFHNVVSWTALISGYANSGQGEEALQCLQDMRKQNLSPNAVTFACILKACVSIGAVDQGKFLHAEIAKEGILRDNAMLATALVDMYAKNGTVGSAKEVFEDLLDRNVIAWTALMAGYAQHGKGEEALSSFEQMLQEGHSPNEHTFSCILKACGCARALQKGKQIHAQILMAKALGKDAVLFTALVDMYGKCGALTEARKLSDGFVPGNIVCWTTLITRYCDEGHVKEALNCFELIQNKGFTFDIVTFACILKACGHAGATAKGEKVHAEIIQSGLIEKMCVLGGALVDMYAKSGALEKAKQAFDKLQYQSVVAWTALLSGYSQAGKQLKVFDLLNKMIKDGVKPNMVTFLVILHACQSLNFIGHSQMYFGIMSACYGILPTSEHIACMVSIFACAGHFDKAALLLEKIPSSTAWLALLNACYKWENLQLGKVAFENLRVLNKSKSRFTLNH